MTKQILSSAGTFQVTHQQDLMPEISPNTAADHNSAKSNPLNKDR